MNNLTTRTLVLAASALMLSLAPTASAFSPAEPKVASTELGTLCPVFVVGACAFLCNAGDHISTAIFWTGQVTASCGGAGSSCVWGINHLTNLNPCMHTGGQASSNGVGTCIAIVVVLAICSAS